MPTAKIYALKETFAPVKETFKTVLHTCVADGLQFPADKPLQRYLLLDRDDFVFPADRTDRYTIVEIAMFEGRSVETIKKMINLIYDRIPAATGIPRKDIDVIVTQVPRHAWGLTGQLGDELQTTYKVAV